MVKISQTLLRKSTDTYKNIPSIQNTYIDKIFGELILIFKRRAY